MPYYLYILTSELYICVCVCVCVCVCFTGLAHFDLSAACLLPHWLLGHLVRDTGINRTMKSVIFHKERLSCMSESNTVLNNTETPMFASQISIPQ